MSAQHIADDAGSLQGMPPRVSEVICQAARDHGVTAAQIVGQDRHRLIAFARFDAASRIRRLRFSDNRAPSLPRIGLWLGGRDHTTILHMLRRWEGLDPQLEAARVYQCAS